MQRLPGCRILLAEDGVDNQRLVSLILRKQGAIVTIMGNGQLAYEAAMQAEQQGQPFDLVLMDMQMPVLDGYGATRKLREAGFQRPIIALTANAMSGDRERCVAAGCTDYAVKPIRREELMTTLCSYFMGDRSTELPTTPAPQLEPTLVG